MFRPCLPLHPVLLPSVVPRNVDLCRESTPPTSRIIPPSPYQRSQKAMSTPQYPYWKRKRQAAVSAAATAAMKKHKSTTSLTPSSPIVKVARHKESSYLADILHGLSEQTRTMHARIVSIPGAISQLEYPSEESSRPGTTMTNNSSGLIAHDIEEKRKLRSRHRTSIFGRDGSIEATESADGPPSLNWDSEIIFDSDAPWHSPQVLKKTKSNPRLLPEFTIIEEDYNKPNKQHQIRGVPQELIAVDPLEDEIYLKAHRRNEILEKRLKNIEKERLQHERLRLERQLEILESPDWKREIGGRGDDGDMAKRRNNMITEIEQVLEKFKKWKDDSKRKRTNEIAEKSQSTPEPLEDSEVRPSGIKIRIKIPRSMQDSRDSTSEPDSIEKDPVPLNMTSISRRFVTPEHRRGIGMIGGRRSGRLTEEWVFGLPLPQMIHKEKEFEIPGWI
ncbi:hypothetical protein NEOLI_001164 [Neolecta irregularis DAH-3]|uniref:Something about silencing protein 4 domain-containing protein n=1 Tax=Neolecta irregularis (strain DAH-3) TaxID=1198029 RepID=A0A1U7LSA4_NEOID|nr:hypothetical protein NEOLI_001164 [Neolecta irregularis DAH-3]|eukprot:OLL25463.1 hypothetical protein NEOLI_001164 [Neolecta irregularis DAH-3]